MFVITGATGHTGSAAAEALLAAGQQVRVVVRDRAKAEPLRARGAEIFVADLADTDALARAVHGAAGVFLISPPDLGAQDFIGERRRLTQRQVDVLAAEKVPHVVLLSSIGAQHASGTGLILSTHHAEQQLRSSGLAATFVRAGYFVENWAAVLGAVKGDGVLPSFTAADRRMPSVSTADIGKAIAQALLEGPRGVRVIELSGPSDVSPNEVAATFSRILGRPVQVVEAPLASIVPTFTSFGMSANIAGLFREMYEGMREGRIAAEGGEQVRGTTPLETTLRALLG
ncbi:MAG TPA: NmrA family NAD(P)-binding protein [Polyangiaceae bacterium]|nr:NmrA family NAD(P)-binding protein [Polyangiaceae bacterium]